MRDEPHDKWLIEWRREGERLRARIATLEAERDEARQIAIGLVTGIKAGGTPQWLMDGARRDFETEAASMGKGENDG